MKEQNTFHKVVFDFEGVSYEMKVPIRQLKNTDGSKEVKLEVLVKKDPKQSKPNETSQKTNSFEKKISERHSKSTKNETFTGRERTAVFLTIFWGERENYTGEQIAQALIASHKIRQAQLIALRDENKLYLIAKYDGTEEFSAKAINQFLDYYMSKLYEFISESVKEKSAKTEISIPIKDHKGFTELCRLVNLSQLPPQFVVKKIQFLKANKLYLHFFGERQKLPQECRVKKFIKSPQRLNYYYFYFFKEKFFLAVQHYFFFQKHIKIKKNFEIFFFS
eukprot:c15230_g1_i1.p1 GENE.c15230_g1_i1~~c15230_g1_i1.p1  ORF type:complete len:278 (+),score=-18.43 c15230_g1_i1:444-1277(+)